MSTLLKLQGGKSNLVESLQIQQVLMRLDLVPTASEARRLIHQGAVIMNGEVVTNPSALLVKHPNYICETDISIGKRKHVLIEWLT